MSMFARAGSYRPRRAAELPPGQREVRAFPRFSDEPLRWAPPLGDPVVEISFTETASAILDLQTVSTSFVEPTHDFHCVTTWSYRGVQWGGFSLAQLVVDELGVDLDTLPPFARAFGADGRHAIFETIDLVDESVLLALEKGGQPLCRRHGGTVRLVCPKQYGYKNVKHLTRIEFSMEQPAGSFGKKEHLRARVDVEERHSSLPNWLLRLPYRATVVPTALAADRGLRNSPSDDGNAD